MFTPTNVILGLKVAVASVTVLLLCSLVALVFGRKQLHGRINLVFFLLTITTVVFFEVIIRFIEPQLTAGFTTEARRALNIHLCFAIPSALILPIMLWSGALLRKWHPRLGMVFFLIWVGTFITGMRLPHSF